jgi:hypothetical protein
MKTMTLDQVKARWREKISRLRDERDWLNLHNHKIEAMVKSEVIEALWSILYDLDRVEDATAVAEESQP